MLSACKVIQIILGLSSERFAFFQNWAGGSQGHCVMILRCGRKEHSTAFHYPGSGGKASAGELCVRSGGAASWTPLVISWIWFCSQKLNRFRKILLFALEPMLAKPPPEKKTRMGLLGELYPQDAVSGLNLGKCKGSCCMATFLKSCDSWAQAFGEVGRIFLWRRQTKVYLISLALSLLERK